MNRYQYNPDTGNFGNVSPELEAFAKSVRSNLEQIAFVLKNLGQGNSSLAVSAIAGTPGGGTTTIINDGTDFVRIWVVIEPKLISNDTYGTMGLELSASGSLDISPDSTLVILE